MLELGFLLALPTKPAIRHLKSIYTFFQLVFRKQS